MLDMKLVEKIYYFMKEYPCVLSDYFNSTVISTDKYFYFYEDFDDYRDVNTSIPKDNLQEFKDIFYVTFDGEVDNSETFEFSGLKAKDILL